MNAKLKALWLEALRSGEYRQANGTLKDSDGGYCCLGVLSHVASEAGMLDGRTEVRETDRGMTVSFTYDEDDESGTWEDNNELYDGCFGLDGSFMAECMARNDGTDDFKGDEQTFAQIADYIEAAVLGSTTEAS